MGRLFVIRHGETPYNAQGVLQGPRIDSPLSELGLRQAWAVGQSLAGHALAAVYTSPLLRARQTADAIVEAAGGGLPVRILPEAYEMDYGDLSGRPMPEVKNDLEQVVDAWSMGFTQQPFPGGESAVVAQHRLSSATERLREHARAAPVAFVAHGDINRILLATLTGSGLDKMATFPQDNGAITELEAGPEAFRIVRLNETRHLK